jgi:hypothetical protein
LHEAAAENRLFCALRDVFVAIPSRKRKSRSYCIDRNQASVIMPQSLKSEEKKNTTQGWVLFF